MAATAVAFVRLRPSLKMTRVAAALALPSDFFDSALRKHVTNLCALHYPARTAAHPSDESIASALDESADERVHPHTDPTSLTVLYHEGGDFSEDGKILALALAHVATINAAAPSGGRDAQRLRECRRRDLLHNLCVKVPSSPFFT